MRGTDTLSWPLARWRHPCAFDFPLRAGPPLPLVQYRDMREVAWVSRKGRGRGHGWLIAAVVIVVVCLVRQAASQILYSGQDGAPHSLPAVQLWYTGFWKHVRVKSALE